MVQVPERIHIDESSTPNHGIFILRPLEEGYGVTIGNAFRRVLLSSIPGYAITAVNAEGVLHEFQTIPGISEDMCEIILNLKGVRLRALDKKVSSVKVHATGKQTFTAATIQESNDQIEILNPEHHIATLSEDADFSMELLIGKGKGYMPAEENRDSEHPVGTIAIDSIFTPIRNATFSVEPFRVGQKTDFEQLTIDIETDGTLTAEEAMEQAAKILRDHVQLFISIEVDAPVEPEDEAKDAEMARIRRILLTQVDDLELSVRSHNCLKAANIGTIAELVFRQESDMLKFRNFGRKSLGELTNIIEQYNLGFGFDVKKYLSEEDMKALSLTDDI